MFDSKSRGEWGLGNREWWWSGSESWKFSVGRAQSYHLWIKGWSNALALWFGFPVFRHTRTMTHPSFHKLLLPSTLQPKQLVPIFSLILPTYSVDFFFFFYVFCHHSHLPNFVSSLFKFGFFFNSIWSVSTNYYLYFFVLVGLGGKVHVSLISSFS